MMQLSSRFLFLVALLGSIPLATPSAEFEIWHSPLDLISSDPALTITPNGAQMQFVQITRSSIVENSAVALGLTLPSDVVIEGITICYAVESEQCFISGMYLSSQNEPPHLTLLHNDPVHLATVGEDCYRTDINAVPVGGTVTLTIELDFWNTAYNIKIGAIAVHVSRPVSDAGELGNEVAHSNEAWVSHHPDPFEEWTEIEFQLSEPNHVDLSIWDTNGRIVRILMEREAKAGPHRTVWDGRGQTGERLPAGKYFYRLRCGDQEQARGVLLLK